MNSPAPRVALRACTPADAAALALVGQATFLETFAGVLEGQGILGHCQREHSVERYAGWLQDARLAAWLAEAEPGGAPIGYALLAPAALPVDDPREDDLELKRIYLLQRFQGLGLGAALMHAAVEAARARGARRLLLGVYAENAAAIAFYSRHGFRTVGRRRFNVGGREYDDAVLALDLRESP